MRLELSGGAVLRLRAKVRHRAGDTQEVADTDGEAAPLGSDRFLAAEQDRKEGKRTRGTRQQPSGED